MIISLIILSILFSVISGFSKAVCDLSEENKIKFYRKTFWIKSLSWKNKWKNGDNKQGEKFFGSSRWFVMFTDAWHLFGFIERIGFIIAYTSVGYLASISACYLFSVLINYILFTGTFHIFYTYKILKK